MRELKFRTWVKKEKRMLFGRDATSTSEFTPNYRYRKDEVEVMQFTGLTDKNGKEVYEGDIVNWYKDTGEVMFHETGWRIKIKDFEVPQSFRYTSLWEIEVIGNIHENPDCI